MKKAAAVNTFQDGMVMDINPLVTPNNVLTRCLNGTLVTYNGDENVLQNDMGNAQVETARLPNGYVPIGTAELGGIIYIASYNPFTKKSQIGSFPSPERNIFLDGDGNAIKTQSLSTSDFIPSNYQVYVIPIEKSGESGESCKYYYKSDKEEEKALPVISNLIVKKRLYDKTLYPGDKFQILASENITNFITPSQGGKIKHISASLATIDNEGRVLYLSNLRQHEIGGVKYPFKIWDDSGIKPEQGNVSVDKYASALDENDYSIFTSRTPGELYIVGRVEKFDSFDVEWELIDIIKNGEQIQYKIKFYFSSSGGTLNHSGVLIESDKLSNDFSSNDGNLTLTVTSSKPFQIKFIPCVPFGILPSYSQTLYIDPSLFGTNIIQHDIYRYYKESDKMLINININSYFADKTKIQSARIYLTPVTELLNTDELNTDKITDIIKSSYNIPLDLKKYSGMRTIQIPFEQKFLPNQLYLFTLDFTLDDNTHIVFYHCLYTNGVFNQEYGNSSSTNFDNIQLPLSVVPNISVNTQITGQKEVTKGLDNQFQLITSSVPDNLRGSTTVSFNPTTDKVTIKAVPTLENDFNLFELSNIVCNTDEIQQSAVECIGVGEKFQSTTTYNIDSEFVTPEYEGNNIDLKIIEQSENQATLSIEGTLYNNISGEYEQSSINVTNYLTPLIDNIQTSKAKLGLYLNSNNKFVFGNNSTYPTIALTNGGSDNNGGGGTGIITGTSKVVSTGSAVVRTDIQRRNDWKSFDIHLDDSWLSQEISKSIRPSDSPFVPVMIVPGGKGVYRGPWHNGGIAYEQYTNGQIRNPASESSSEMNNNFSAGQTLNWATVWLFIRNSSGLLQPSTYIHTFNHSQVDIPIIDVIGKSLTQIYVRKNQEHVISGYIINNISSYDTIEYQIKLAISGIHMKSTNKSTNGNWNGNIKIYGKYLKEIQDIVEDFTKGNYLCLKHESFDTEINSVNVSTSIRVPNALKNLFYENQKMSSAKYFIQDTLDTTNSKVVVDPIVLSSSNMHVEDTDAVYYINYERDSSGKYKRTLTTLVSDSASIKNFDVVKKEDDSISLKIPNGATSIQDLKFNYAKPYENGSNISVKIPANFICYDPNQDKITINDNYITGWSLGWIQPESRSDTTDAQLIYWYDVYFIND